MPANLTTFPHFSVSPADELGAAGVTGNGTLLKSAIEGLA